MSGDYIRILSFIQKKKTKTEDKNSNHSNSLDRTVTHHTSRCWRQVVDVIGATICYANTHRKSTN